jgi:ArsR family transcriptional regulator, arsenate/arsenite/antimonite-responsive transcriptional repressor
MPNNAVFKALADPTRRQIIKMLNRGELSAGDIAKAFPISAPSMSHHFGVLKEADLVFARREGQQILYSLNTTVFEDVMAVLFDIFKKSASVKRRKP